MTTGTQIEVHRGKRGHASVLEEMERMRDAISRRAYDLFQCNGSIFGREFDDWFAAEREMIWKPPIDFCETDGRFEVRVALPGVDPKELDVRVTPERLLIQGRMNHDHKEENGTLHTCEFGSGRLFRVVEFPRTIDPDKVTATCLNGMLILSAPAAQCEKAGRVDIHAA